MSYPSERLDEEIAYLAYYLHWSCDEIMSLEHRERQKWVGRVGDINRRLQTLNQR